MIKNYEEQLEIVETEDTAAKKLDELVKQFHQLNIKLDDVILKIKRRRQDEQQ